MSVWKMAIGREPGFRTQGRRDPNFFQSCLKCLPLVHISDGTAQAVRPLLKHAVDRVIEIRNRDGVCKAPWGVIDLVDQ